MNKNRRSAIFTRWIAGLGLAATIVLPALARSGAPTAATQVTAEGVRVLPGSKLWIEGTSTLHPWSSVATQLAVTVAPAARPALDPLVRAGSVEKLVVAVPVAAMRSDKAALDKNMRTALKAEKHPEIRWQLAKYVVVGGSAADSFTIRATGALTIAGVERTIEIDARATRDDQGLRLRGTEEVLMSEYGIKPPKLMMGTLRTGDRVQVHFDLRLADDAGTGVANGSTAP